MGKPTSKQIDRLIERIYYQHGEGVQINILDISKIFAAGRDAYARGESMEAAVVTAIANFRQN